MMMFITCDKCGAKVLIEYSEAHKKLCSAEFMVEELERIIIEEEREIIPPPPPALAYYWKLISKK